ncbi:CST complex subunit CTC1 isoform X2 [Platichthys flesus]|uniref:CST complex subunit CTC1 isoform X2 n=1 Tax=Platichthys flesus TaxID=8260 RepID=UPI002DBFEAD1|nr:CST complex subunit CTC1 isoform X2 [Platichthys flesus]
MNSEQLFVELMHARGDSEASWLKHVLSFVSQQVCPLLTEPAPAAADDLLTGAVLSDVCVSLSVCVVKTLQEITSVTHTLPVSYRLVSVSELVSQQHLACVSHLSWSTNQQRAWAREAELSLPGIKALPWVNLLLIGCLREGRGGEWRLMNSSGSVRCEFLSLSPHWLNRLVFLPHWNYIPHNALGQDEAGGYVEVIGSPVLLSPGPEQGLVPADGRGAELIKAVGVREAAALLHIRVPGQRASVCGQVGSVCPLLVVAGTTFFCFTLTEERHTVSVLVKENSRLWWSQCVCVGQSVCVTALRVCVLRGWRGNNILCVTDQSEIHTNYTPAHTLMNDTHAESQSDTPPSLMLHADEDVSEEAESEGESGRSLKQARVISYQGEVTEVVSEGAGLYVIDRKVGLCLAYQPTQRRSLRAGDCVELHNVHFLYRPCPDFLPSMLCTCLRSSIRVTSFSRGGGGPPDTTCPGDGALPRLLLETNRGVSEYLWTCHLSTRLSHSLVPSVLKQQQCVCVLSWKLMELMWGRERGRVRRRDIYSEMLDESHTCPLTQYSVDPAVPQYVSVSELVLSLQSDCWSSVSLRSLLPLDGSSLTSSEINAALAWSFWTQRSDPRDDLHIGDTLRQRPLLLVGILELPSQMSESEHTLQLRDGTAAVTCIVTETSEEEEGGQRAAFNTAWIGCLVCVHQFTMVTERFLQSDFPSCQHLDQEQFITHKHCRVYLQFSLDHLHILSPSVSMMTLLRQRGVATTGEEEEEEEEEKERKRRKKRREEADAPHSASSVSIVFRVEQKGGLAWRNMGDEGGGVVLDFTVRVAVIGPVVSWGRDPKNVPMTDREIKREEEKVDLVFSGVSARWFPLLQPGCYYRLVAANAQDPSVLIGCDGSGRSGMELHTDSTLQIQSDWRFHTLTRPLQLHTCRQPLSPTVLSVSDVLDCSSELVCFQGLVCDRISLNNRTSECGHTRTNTGVRLTMCDRGGRSLKVYLDLSHTPYPPGLLPGNTLRLSAFQRRLSRRCVLQHVTCQLPQCRLSGRLQICSSSSCSHHASGSMGSERGAEWLCGSGQRSRGVFSVCAAAMELLAVWDCLLSVLFQFSVSFDHLGLSVQSKIGD